MGDRTAEGPSDFQIGITGGATPSTFNGEQFDDTTMKLGFVGGARAIVPFHQNFGMQPELLFLQRGTAFDEIDSQVTLNYLQAPILFRVSAPVGPVTPKLLVGPTVGVLLNGSVDVDGVDIGVDTDDFARVDIGGTVGAGVDIEAGPGSFSLDARVGQSLMDITTANPNAYNRAFDFLAGYNFRF